MPPKPRPKRIALLGNFGVGNHGNDATLEAAGEMLRRLFPQAQQVCIAPNGAALRAGMEHIPLDAQRRGAGLAARGAGKLADLAHAARAARGLDLLVLPGTGLFDVGPRESALGWPFALWRWTRAAAKAGADCWILNMGCAPAPNGLTRALLAGAARRACYHSYRDEYSLAAMRAAGLARDDAQVVPDLVFGLEALPPKGAQAEAIGLGVMARNWPSAAHERDYIENLAAVAQGVLAGGRKVRLLIGEDRDETVREAVRTLVPEVEAPAIRNVHDLMAAMQDVRAIAATRFHNIVCALKLAKPTVCISYDRRHEEMMAAFGQTGLCCDVGEFTPQGVLAMLDAAMRDAAAIGAVIAAKAQTARARLTAQEERLAQLY